MKTFYPDLIVEVTAACNRSCVGCYAPNVVTNQFAAELYVERPELFLSIFNINSAFGKMSRWPYLTAIRGGEPSLHPKLATLLLISARHSKQVMLETHARWLLPENVNEYGELVEAIRSLGVIIKISFDKMHGLSKEDLHKITQFLDLNQIDYRIAISETLITEFLITRNLCSWITDSKILYQLKAKNNSELVTPTLGVINIAGEFCESITSKFSEVALV